MPATVLATREMAMDSESVKVNSAHCTMAEGVPSSVDYNVDLYADVPGLLPPSTSVCPVATTEVVFVSSLCPELSYLP